ncbi:MAG: hypothetical protein N4J56_000799 [Chroococcidiopsis sp. SAG 2025]|uniref:hypothetical protein n=1 Tax=Chroococcidiopsis sp. SAG 2025 TaxID=171389 RepID=UPI0029373E88|nr:hypothetical protein [Chroococcidiopsis sp. SAG 2025]MDV2991145.1 hypothetical protein [Chroococcidiopsis sp. SAG 2025]
MRDTSCQHTDRAPASYRQQAYNIAKKSYHSVRHLIIEFWRFSNYYAEYKARMRGQ